MYINNYGLLIFICLLASEPDVKIRVTCGPSVATAPRCPAVPVSQSETVDDVEDLPDRKDTKPSM